MNIITCVVSLLSFVQLDSTSAAVHQTPSILKNFRIIGGFKAAPYEFSSIVSLSIPGVNLHNCGGTILNSKWIITAAHCSKNHARSYLVVAGQHNIEIDEEFEQARAVERIVVHPDYATIGIVPNNDIALWKLTSPLVFDERIQPVKLPPRYDQPYGNCSVAGWGSVNDLGDGSVTLLTVDVDLVDDRACRALYSKTTLYKITDAMICAGKRGQGSCYGDSGGPMLCSSNDGQVQLCGIVSWGYGITCEKDEFPDVYTRTSHFIDWIEQTIGEKVA